MFLMLDGFNGTLTCNYDDYLQELIEPTPIVAIGMRDGDVIVRLSCIRDDEHALELIDKAREAIASGNAKLAIVTH